MCFTCLQTERERAYLLIMSVVVVVVVVVVGAGFWAEQKRAD